MKARRAPGAGRPQKAPEARAGRRVSTRLYAGEEEALELLRMLLPGTAEATLLRLGLHALAELESRSSESASEDT